MKITLHTQGYELTGAIDAHVRKQLNRHLGVFKEHVMGVEVFLSDINGHKGGHDKKALLTVQLAGRQTVITEAVHEDLYAAISAATKQAKRGTKRSIKKRMKVEKALLRELRQYPADVQAV